MTADVVDESAHLKTFPGQDDEANVAKNKVRELQSHSKQSDLVSGMQAVLQPTCGRKHLQQKGTTETRMGSRGRTCRIHTG